MDCLKFSQKEGFTTTVDPTSDIPGTDCAATLKAAGYVPDMPALHRYGTDTDDFDARNLVSIKIFRKGKTDAFLIDLWDSTGGKYILVDGEADLFALHLRLAPLLMIGVESTLDAIFTLARKAFRAWHGHGQSESCNACDPHEMNRRRRLKGKAPDDDPSGLRGL